jgi:hypothetical protein
VVRFFSPYRFELWITARSGATMAAVYELDSV